MIDIHSHILPSVDDGCQTEEEALLLLEEDVCAGVTDVILTPHHKNDCICDPEVVKEKFDQFKKIVNERGIKVNLYLGQEVYIGSENLDFINRDNILTLNNSPYVLVEFDFSVPQDILNIVYELSVRGFKPIVCHYERYFYADLDLAVDIKNNGGFIQVNADSLTRDSRMGRRFARKLLKYRLIDFVASDIHMQRKNCMAKAYKLVLRKCGYSHADEIFNTNAKEIIG